MSLEFQYMRDPGEPTSERVIFRASGNLDVGNYCLLASSTNNKQEPTSGGKVAFWFPDKEVGNGDTVVVYTKAGDDKSRKNDDGTQSHFFYWGRTKSLWSVENNGVVVLQARTWNFHLTKVRSQTAKS
ncbi:hypothetical protein [Enhydrobacter aerosaccus]|uniref:hypothetical protein n=1 Tax=Enhydrobacter aerosaccus TaxID=225324 RepID=UPI0011175EC5|nr:hypothetical protein [Enhydrobacter aerosaccus]